MVRRKVLLPLIAGLCLIVISLGLVLFFQIRMQSGWKSAQEAVNRLSQLLPEKTLGVPGSYSDPLMPALQIEGVDYAAILKIPALDMTLPVADQWDSSRLDRSPARFFGSAYDNTLVIGGTDNAMQFGFCDTIDQGVTITVTDMTGAEFTYTVARVDRSESAETPWLCQENWDLTLFCREQYAMTYIAIRCIAAYK